jgi:hypothetical protein
MMKTFSPFLLLLFLYIAPALSINSIPKAIYKVSHVLLNANSNWGGKFVVGLLVK